MIFLLLLFSIETLIASWDLNYFFMFAIVYNLIVYPFSKYLTYSNTKDIDPLLNFLQQYCSPYFLELFKTILILYDTLFTIFNINKQIN